MLSRNNHDTDHLDVLVSPWLQPDGILENVSVGQSTKSMSLFPVGRGNCENE
jgi:hypothetical protein